MKAIRTILLLVVFSVGIGVISALALLEASRVVLVFVSGAWISTLIFIMYTIEKEN